MRLTGSNEMQLKVPIVITLYFWIIKILATTVGETGADYLTINMKFGMTVTSVLMVTVLLAVLFVQIKHAKYNPWLYWLTVVLVSIVGTLLTDNLTDNLGVPLGMSTLSFTLALGLTFWLWYRVESALSIHSIYTVRRELFYWAAILLTFALGTAAGDLLAEGLGLGFAVSGVIFAILIAMIAAGFYVFKLNGVLMFWLAYIVTRPLGASIGDYLTQPFKAGGLGLGTTTTSAVFLLLIVGLVIYLSMTRLDAEKEPAFIKEINEEPESV